ncbi:MAG: isoprenylcysteine carboxylmethyltransferase family protein, partial [Candidatus Cloacimonetes bacterium]|nr:isoprenylcysteine carboxylmethyltransferase family protein [Candidatus Cloacimonadota bacterium]
MILSDLIRVQGNWLFRNRSYLPLLLVFLVVVALYPEEPLKPYTIIKLCFNAFAIAIGVLGLVVRIATVGFVPARTSGRNTMRQVADELNTTGIYSIVRHPLYIGNYLMWLGIILYTQSWWLTLTFTVLYMLYYERIMIAEESYLIEKFGQAYPDWAAVTPAFLPA